jgi:beta-glucosidase
LVAASADQVLVFLGLPTSYESEGFDRTHLDLPSEQLAVLEEVAAVSEHVVVVLANGAVVVTEPWEHLAAAIVEGWLGGQAGGGAIADVLVGDVNPSGRLAETIPVRLSDTPSYLSFPGDGAEVIYGEGIHVGYRYYDAVEREVAYPFGHGLSYTTFEHSSLRARVLEGPELSTAWRGAPRLEVSVEITNTGDRAGKEVVQLYVAALDAVSLRPPRELKAFEKVELGPGASTTATFTLTERDLSCWSTRADDWVLEPGTFEVAIGASSRDIRCATTVEIDGPPPVLPLDRSSTLGEWLAHPTGREHLVTVLRAAPGGDLSPLVANPERVRIIASFPLPRLLTMLGGTAGAAMIDDLLRNAGR